MRAKSYPRIESFSPRECISSKVLRIHRLTANVFRTHLKEFGVTDSQLSVLFMLCKMKDLTQQRLSDLTCLDKSTMSRNLQRLYDRGYVSKAHFPTLHITEKGKTLVNDIIPAWEKAMTEVGDRLGEEGQDALDVVLSNMMTQIPRI